MFNLKCRALEANLYNQIVAQISTQFRMYKAYMFMDVQQVLGSAQWAPISIAHQSQSGAVRARLDSAMEVA
jgi:hypothetical protein